MTVGREGKCSVATYASLSSRSLGMVISSILSTRFDADSSSYDIDACLRHASNEGSGRKTPSKPSSFMIGWLLRRYTSAIDSESGQGYYSHYEVDEPGQSPSMNGSRHSYRNSE